MRRMLALVSLAALLLTGGCAYAAVTGQEEGGYQLYFQTSDLSASLGGDALRPQTIYLEGAENWSTQTLAETLLTRLLEGPEEEGLTSAIPAGTSLLEVTVQGSRAQVDLSSAYSTLSGVELTLADCAITMTLTQLPGISLVGVTVRGRELAYRDKQVFTARDILFSSTEDVVGTVAVSLYFPNESGTLTPEERTLELYEGDTQAAAVLKGLAAGPENKDLSAVVPEGFYIRSTWLEEQVCYVNLSSSALENLEEGTSMAPVLRAMALSLRSLETVEEVRFLVDGEYAARYGDAGISGTY